jgi:zinc transport system permease protein
MDLAAIFIEPFSHDFMRSALALSLLIALMCGVLGSHLVPRGLSMLGDGLAHATLGGVGAALLVGLSPGASIWAAMPVAIGVAFGIVWLGKHANIAGDAALGVFFAVSLAAGVAAVHVVARRGVSVDLESLLFGNILATEPHDVWIISGLAVLFLVVNLVAGPRMAYAGFYPDMAAMSGIRVQLKEYLLMGLTAVVTVTAVRAVGVLLVSAYLVIPTVAARLLVRRLGPMMLTGISAGVAGSAFGLILSYHLDVPTGAAMTLALGGVFAVCLLLRGMRRESR